MKILLDRTSADWYNIFRRSGKYPGERKPQ